MKVRDGAPDAPVLGPAGARPVVPVDVAEMRDWIRSLDPPHLVRKRRRLTDLADDLSESGRVGTALPQQPCRLPRHRDMEDLVPAAFELRPDDAVELALVRLEAGDEEAHSPHEP